MQGTLISRRRIAKAARLSSVIVRRPQLAYTVARVQRRRLTMLSSPALLDLAQAVAEIERHRLPGVVIEAGTALGGSAIVIAAAKRPRRPFYVHDVFGQIPPPDEMDGSDVHARYAEIVAHKAQGIAGERYYGYRDDLMSEVQHNFARAGYPLEDYNVHLVPGLFQATLRGDAPVALAHLDGDWYASVMTCLRALTPRLVQGGRLVIDDYADWSGCRRAVDEFLRSSEGQRLQPEWRERLHLVRR
jgi:hypothetical protein